MNEPKLEPLARTRRRTLAYCAVLLAALTALLSLHWPSRGLAAPPGRRPPPDARAPARVSNLLSTLTQTSAVIEGVVSAIEHEYSEEDGPRTVVTLSSVHAREGSAPPEVKLRNFGGPTPDGRYLAVSDQPQFVLGATYVVLLRNTAWSLSPVLDSLAFRVDTLEDGREAMVDTDGNVVEAVNETGFVRTVRAFEPVDLDGARPARAAHAPAHARALSRAELVAAVRQNLGARRMRLTTDFYDLPQATANWREGPVTPHAADIPPSRESTPVPDVPPTERSTRAPRAPEATP
jgi:hypothetical protein